MIVSLFAIILYLFYFLGWGLLCKELTKLKLLVFSELFLAGMLSASLLSIFLAFFFPLNIYVEIIGIMLSCLGFVLGRKQLVYYVSFKKYYYQKRSFLCCVLLLLIAASFSPFIFDHYGYYIPTITVLDSKGIVIGIVNLQTVLGQNSLWHILQSFTNNTFDFYLSLNVFLVFTYILFVFESKRFVLLFFVPLFFLFVQSPSPDLPVIIISIIVVYKSIFEKSITNFAFLLALSVFIFVIKPTAFWVPGFILISAIINRKVSLKMTIIPMVLVLLFVVKNVLSSGNILFPVEQFYLDVDWKPNAVLIDQSANIATQKTYDFQYDIEEVKAFSYRESVLKWFSLKGIKSSIHSAVLLVFVGFVVFSFFKKNKIYIILAILISIKLVLVFWFSGQYRFMLDAVLVCIMLLFLDVKIKPQVATLCALGLAVLLLMGLAFPQIIQKTIPSFNVGNMMQNVKLSQFYKPVRYGISDYSKYKVGNLEFNTPNNYPYLLDIPFPAISKPDLKTYLDLGIFPQRREKIIIMEVLSKDSKKDLNSILNH